MCADPDSTPMNSSLGTKKLFLCFSRDDVFKYSRPGNLFPQVCEQFSNVRDCVLFGCIKTGEKITNYIVSARVWTKFELKIVEDCYGLSWSRVVVHACASGAGTREIARHQSPQPSNVPSERNSVSCNKHPFTIYLLAASCSNLLVCILFGENALPDIGLFVSKIFCISISSLKDYFFINCVCVVDAVHLDESFLHRKETLLV